jgi:hypothetical protein
MRQVFPGMIIFCGLQVAMIATNGSLVCRLRGGQGALLLNSSSEADHSTGYSPEQEAPGEQAEVTAISWQLEREACARTRWFLLLRVVLLQGLHSERISPVYRAQSQRQCVGPRESREIRHIVVQSG